MYLVVEPNKTGPKVHYAVMSDEDEVLLRTNDEFEAFEFYKCYKVCPHEGHTITSETFNGTCEWAKVDSIWKKVKVKQMPLRRSEACLERMRNELDDFQKLIRGRRQTLETIRNVLHTVDIIRVSKVYTLGDTLFKFRGYFRLKEGELLPRFGTFDGTFGRLYHCLPTDTFTINGNEASLAEVQAYIRQIKKDIKFFEREYSLLENKYKASLELGPIKSQTNKIQRLENQISKLQKELEALKLSEGLR